MHTQSCAYYLYLKTKRYQLTYSITLEVHICILHLSQMSIITSKITGNSPVFQQLLRFGGFFVTLIYCGKAFWHQGPPLQHGWTLIPAWKSNLKPSIVWHEITYLFPNFYDCTVGNGKVISSHTFWLCDGCDYLFMLEFKLIHVSKRGSRYRY